MKKIEENTVIDKKDLKEIKLELLDYAKVRIDIEVENSLKKVEKKIVKRKNIKIIKRDYDNSSFSFMWIFSLWTL